MSRHTHRFWAWFFIAITALSGCHPIQPFYVEEDGDLSHYIDAATQIEYPDVDDVSLAEVTEAKEPFTVSNPQPEEFWDLSLEEAISIALNNSKVIRSFGTVRRFGSTVTGAPERSLIAPDSTATIYDPALVETSTGGVEAALANFDAQLQGSLVWDRTDRAQNSSGGVANQFVPFNLRQDQLNGQLEISKLAATGTQFFARHNTIYEDSNTGIRSPIFADFFSAFEFEARQPLLRGRGTQVTRIPLMVARIREDISIADFEIRVRDFVREVEQAYWELYFFYRNLAATEVGRDSALGTWQRIDSLSQAGRAGGEAENVAQSKEQYFFFRSRLEDALNQVYQSEGNLRYLLGLTASDRRLIRPKDEPIVAKVAFNWDDVRTEAMVRSVEIRRHKWRIKQRELELIAARNQLLPQLDLQMLYRFLGRGEDLIRANPSGARYRNRGSNAFEELTTGDFQEGTLGVTFSMPIGFRAQLAQVRSSQLQLARDRAVLETQQLELVHNMRTYMQDLDAKFKQMQSNVNRVRAAKEEVEAIKVSYEAGVATLDRLLDAQRRRSDAEVTLFQSIVEYNLAIMNIHWRKGSLLEFNNVYLAEGQWPAKAYFDARTRARQRDASYFWNYGYSRPKVISRGPVPSKYDSGGADGEAGPTADEDDPRLEPVPSPAELKLEDAPSPGEILESSSPLTSDAGDTELDGPSLDAPIQQAARQVQQAKRAARTDAASDVRQASHDTDISLEARDSTYNGERGDNQDDAGQDDHSASAAAGRDRQPARVSVKVLNWKTAD